ncbi:DUF4214 domain-containing protein [Shinella zoogloeoides]|uniref:DUF4214 domain-containing protein n=1 Tax=Shinella zoogloeoides TaxID=352475 RepID=UPI001F56D5A5|nr:DUF4214 domain-containing protein [Shinella zoogloeoides]
MEPNELITQLYVGYYNRAPDPEGLNYWMGRLAAGVSLADIAESFATSPEAISTYPWLAVEEPTEAQVGAFLETIYQNMFNRSIDSDGLAYYSNQLLTGERTAGEIIASIQANANTNPNNTDGTILANKVEVGLAWALAAEAQPGFEYNAEAAASANSILDGVNATQASVDAALGIVEEFFDAPASLEGAIQALLEAREAQDAQAAEVADFLEGAYDNELVAAETTDTNGDGDVDAEDVIAADITDANDAAADALINASNGSIAGSGNAFNGLTDAAQEARIETARTDLQADIDAAQEDADDAAEALEDGVAEFAQEAQAASEALTEALNARDEQDDVTADTVTAANALVSDTTATDPVTFALTATAGEIEADDTNGAIAITELDGDTVKFSSNVALNAAGTAYVITFGTETATITKSYLDELLAAAQADYDAAEAVEDAQEALASAIVDALEAQDDNYDGSGVDYAALSADVITVNPDNSITLDYSDEVATGGALIDTYAAELVALADAEDALEEFEAAVVDWQGTDALADELEALQQEASDLADAVAYAEDQITNDENGTPAGLNTDLFETPGTVNFDAGDDVYLFTESTTATTINSFSVAGDDSIYFGAGYKLVALGDDDITDNVGNVGELEIFWKEVAGDLVLYVENETFAGNGSTSGDITTITLDGVSGDEVALVGGFLVEAEAAVA